MSPPSFPQAFPWSGAPFPPRGSSGWFPRFIGTVKHSDFLSPFARRFVSFASRYLARLGLRSRGRKAQRPGPGVVHRIPQNRFIAAETTGPPRFLEDPSGRAVLYDSGETSALDHCRALVLSSANWKASTLTTNIHFGAPSHGPHIRCLRFAGWIAPSPRKTRFRMAGQPFRAGFVPARVPSKSFRSSHPPFPGFPGAPRCEHQSGPRCIVKSTQPHPRYGNGLFLLQSFPIGQGSDAEGVALALSLNATELAVKPSGYASEATPIEPARFTSRVFSQT